MTKWQTVERVIDTAVDRVYEARDLLGMSEEEFAKLRRLGWENRHAQTKDAGIAPRLVCAICRQPVYLSRQIREEGNRWFSHHAGVSAECPWHEGNKLSPDVHRALIYRGEQEGEEHRRLKRFLTLWLEKEPGVSEVRPEQVTYGEILKGERKRPDVKCVLAGKRIVFEIQLSYTFLSEVIKRDTFYRVEGIFIIWVFNKVNLERAVVLDEAFHNHRNLFVIDDAAVAETERRGRLTFCGRFQNPMIREGKIEDVWKHRWLTLDDVRFPMPEYRPFFFDYEATKRELIAVAAEVERKAAQDFQEREAAQAEARREAELARVSEAKARRLEEAAAFEAGVKRYQSAALRYFDQDYAEREKSRMLDAAEALSQHTLWESVYEALCDERFYGWHRVLPVLLSIKHNRAVGYKYTGVNQTFQVLEAGLRQTTNDGTQFGLAIVCIWAYEAYKPALSAKHRQWVQAEAQRIKSAIDAKERRYFRFIEYDEVISLLFPELEEDLNSEYAIEVRD